MKRFTITCLSIAFALTMIASAETAPGDPHAPLRPGMNEAMVRLVHASPHAEVERLLLTDGATGLTQEFSGVAYLEVTEYVPIFAGSYDVTLELAPVDEAHQAFAPERLTIDAVEGEFYTIVLIGLVLPTDAVGPADDFFAWLEDLFTADRNDLTLWPMVLDDLTQVPLAQTEVEVRLVHAAPGTDAVDLVLVRPDDADVLHSESYGNASGHATVVLAEGDLQIRMAGSDAVVADLAGLDLTPGMIHTVILTGTPIEDVPLRAIVVTNPWLDPIAAPAAPGAAAPVPGALPAAEAAWVRDRIVEVQYWLESAEARLAALTEVGEAEEQAAAALQEVAASRAALEEARLQLEAVTPPDTPTAPDD